VTEGAGLSGIGGPLLSNALRSYCRVYLPVLLCIGASMSIEFIGSLVNASATNSFARSEPALAGVGQGA